MDFFEVKEKKDKEKKDKDASLMRLKFLSRYVKEASVEANNLAQELGNVLKGKGHVDDIENFGADVARATMYKWREIIPKSRSRELGVLARYSVLEAVNVQNYRALVLKSPGAHLRTRLEQILAASTDPVTRAGKEIHEWKFWDGLFIKNPEKIPEIQVGSHKERIKMLEIAEMPAEQKKELAHIVKVVESSNIACYELGAKYHTEENVANALMVLVEVNVFAEMRSHH